MTDPKPPSLKTFSITMRFDAENLARAVELLLCVCGPIGAKRGCRVCVVKRDAGNPDAVYYREEWDSEEAFLRHVRSKEFWRVLLAVDLCSEEPQVGVGDLSAQYGMDVLRKLLESQSPVA